VAPTYGTLTTPLGKAEVAKAGDTTSVLPVTVNVTGITAGLPDSPAAVMVTVPLYVPAAGTTGFTLTYTVAGVE
jgi:hypothetical protein